MSVATTRAGKDRRTKSPTRPRSGALFGYARLFMPMIPPFSAGEEFDAMYRPIPWLLPNYLEAGSDNEQVQMKKMFAAGPPSTSRRIAVAGSFCSSPQPCCSPV